MHVTDEIELLNNFKTCGNKSRVRTKSLIRDQTAERVIGSF